jgi:hypothetical protein
MATTNDSQLTDFLNYFNNTRITPNFTAAQKAAEVMKFFSVDTPNPNPSVFSPYLGITDHGPAFIKVDEVKSSLAPSFSTSQRLGRAPLGARKATTTARQHLRFSLLMGRSRV